MKQTYPTNMTFAVALADGNKARAVEVTASRVFIAHEGASNTVSRHRASINQWYGEIPKYCIKIYFCPDMVPFLS